MEMEVKWYEWCRLCARGDSGSENIDLGSYTNLANISTAIGKYFWVNIKPSDPHKFVCQSCYALINLLIGFTERVNKVQAMFLMLQSSKSDQMDPFEVRSQFDLLDEDWEHIINSYPRSSELEYEEAEESFDDDERMELSNSEADFQDSMTNQDIIASDAKSENDSENSNLKPPLNIATESADEEIKVTIEEHQQRESVGDGLECLQKISDKNIVCVDNEEQNEAPRKRKQSYGDNEQIIITESKSDEYEKHTDETKDLLNTPKYRCKTCGKHYKNATSYRKHLESHNVASDLPDFVCDECGKVLATERQLTQHKRTHLPLEEKLTVECQHCNKKYINEAVLKQHIIHMHTEQSYVCEECGMTLKRLASLKDHKLTHTNVLAFKCEQCDKAFKNKSRLKAHKDAVHSSTNYQCSQCELTLNSKRTLKMHMLVHTNEKGYKCNFCGAEFKRGKSLKNHLIIHIGLRPYKCNFCGKSFTNGSNCRAHKRKIHPLELEAEEAAGLKNKSTVVPNLYELRASESVQEPRTSTRNRGGITPKMRALLVAAEQLESTTPNNKIERLKQFKLTNESSDLQVVQEFAAENNSECFEQEIEDETLVFEIIGDDNL